MSGRPFHWFIILLLGFWLASGHPVRAQVQTPDTSRPGPDSLTISLGDSLPPGTQSSANPAKEPFDFPIQYKARDSITMALAEKMAYLYGDARIVYGDIELTAGFIAINMAKKEVFARALKDSAGLKTGKPHFKEKDQEFDAETLKYNFDTRQGFITDVFSEQEGGYLHSAQTKKLASNEVCVKNGKYTTCDLEHPHFYIGLTKAKIIPGDKIVTGPAYLSLADIIIPIGIPFGFFPNKKGSSSGILIPNYGEETRRGFFLRDGGYYMAISDRLDATLRGDVYSKGTWGLKLHTNYKTRYRYSGNFDIKLFRNVVSEPELPDYSTSRDFSIVWNHSQDPKANPNSTLSASVNFSSSSFDQNQSFGANNYLTNTKSSSISYSSRLSKDINFSANLRHSQNSLNKSVDLTLPSMNLSMNRIYPFRKESSGSDLKWYENIEFSYTSKLDNRINTYDSLVFKREVFDDFQTGFQHSIPVSANFKFWNFFNFSPRLTYSGWFYPSYLQKTWSATHIENGDTIPGALVTDTVHQFIYGHEYSPTVSLSASPTIYGMFTFSQTRFNRKIKAIRHVINPSVSLNLKPDMTGLQPDYYRTVQIDDRGRTSDYSVFQGGLFGGPGTSGRSGSVGLNLNNNLEMKVRKLTDTAEVDEKIKLLESLTFSTNYDLFKDSLNWSVVSIRGRTTLFGNLGLNFGGSLDPYALDTAGRVYNAFEWNESGSFGRLTSANFSLNYAITPGGTSSGQKKDTPPGNRGDYSDFDIPWSLRVDYSWNYSKPAFKSVVTQSLRFSGDIRLTPNWKINFSSGYDFENKELTYTTFDFSRDLHCWEMHFTWVPFGARQSYSFQINVKSSILKDLKWQKNQSWYDNY